MQWSETFERNYLEWKEHGNEFVNVCERKGRMKLKEKWERETEAAIKLNETRLKEIYEELEDDCI